jgi:hypothetical protein
MVRLVYIAFFYSSRKYIHPLYLRQFLYQNIQDLHHQPILENSSERVTIPSPHAQPASQQM